MKVISFGLISKVGIFMVFFVSITANGVVVYDFENGLDGWTNVMTSTTPEGAERFSSQAMPYSTIPDYNVPDRLTAYHGTYFIAPDPFVDRDNAHQTLLMRSPEFYLYSQGSISAYISAGAGSGDAPVSVSDIPTESNTAGFLGLALRRVSDNVYVAAFSRSNNGDDSWQHVTLEASEIADYVSQSERYTLDLIDYDHGSWGWMAVDYVEIESGTVVVEPEYTAPDCIGMEFYSARDLIIDEGFTPGLVRYEYSDTVAKGHVISQTIDPGSQFLEIQMPQDIGLTVSLGRECINLVPADFNGDCVVDVADFVVFASYWLLGTEN